MKAIHATKPFSFGFCSLFALVFLIGLSSCQEEDSSLASTLSFDDGVELSLDEADAEATFEELEEIALGVEEEALSDPERRLAAPPIILWRCADIERDTAEKTITVDFGEGCEGADGRVRRGTILISYNRRLHIPGASRSIEFIGFSVDSVEIEGKKTLTNTTENAEGYLSYQSTLEGGKITWPDGSYATREVNRTRTWIRGNNPAQDEFQITGSVEGVTRKGNTYSVSIDEPLIYKRICRRSGIFLAVSGIKSISNSARGDLEVNYGEGDCDSSVTLTIGEESKEVDIRREWRKRNRRN